jgi:hypothetical protein
VTPLYWIDGREESEAEQDNADTAKDGTRDLVEQRRRTGTVHRETRVRRSR